MKLKITQRTLIIGVAAVAAVAFIGVGVSMTRRHGPHAAHGTAAKGTYYCPMHPTYTSDRPGDCPICNMRLVKREAAAKVKDICYLHNCPKIHEGRPCPMTVVAKPGEKVTCPICGTHIAEAAEPSQGRKILYWTDPMIPGYRADRPGKSPMGMELVPVYEEDATAQPTPAGATVEGYAPVLLSPQKQQLIGVRTAEITRRDLTKTIRTVGTVAHDTELYQTQAELIRATTTLSEAQVSGSPEILEQAQRLIESVRLHLRHVGLSEPMIQEIETWTEPDHRLLLGGGGQYWVYASIYEYELPLVQVGQAAMIEVSALTGQQFTGTVKAIDRILDPATRTARVRILTDDQHGVLKPEMYVNVSISVALGQQLAVPKEAVFDTGVRRIVFIDKGQGVFEPRDVTIGAAVDELYEVTGGLAEGERVVTSGNFLIDSESRLKAALEGAVEGDHQHGQ